MAILEKTKISIEKKVEDFCKNDLRIEEVAWDVLDDLLDKWTEQIKTSFLWQQFRKDQPKIERGYKELKERNLALNSISWQRKSIDSIKGKLYRDFKSGKKVKDLWNYHKGIPKLNDLIRTRIVCRYMDGVPYILNNLESISKRLKIQTTNKLDPGSEEYFAYHFRFKNSFEVPGTKKKITLPCEIQIATELGTRIWEETHLLYELEREGYLPDTQWKWDKNDARFLGKQLGHLLHTIDGLILDAQNRFIDIREDKT